MDRLLLFLLIVIANAGLAQTVADMGLRYVVVTSVDRDDLPDGGAAHFVRTIEAVRASSPASSWWAPRKTP